MAIYDGQGLSGHDARYRERVSVATTGLYLPS